MGQLLHIFRKDVRGLWGELAVFLVSLALASWSFSSLSPEQGQGPFFEVDSWAGEVLALIAGCYLIARLVHAETIPGSSQFWLTRPYRGVPLLGAKLLFILIFIQLPVFAAQALMLWNTGFTVWGNLPALLWVQVLLLACVSLPASAIAAVTRGLTGFVLFVVGGWISAYLVTLVVFTFFREPVMDDMIVPAFLSGRLWSADGSAWAVYAVLVVSVAAAALPVLYAQYGRRRTSLSRKLLAAIFVIGVAVSVWGGYGLRWKIQMLASTETLDTEQYQVSLGEPTWIAAVEKEELIAEWPPASFSADHTIDLYLPVVIQGVAPQIDMWVEHASLSFQAADGEFSQPSWVEIKAFRHSREGTTGLAPAGPERHYEMLLRIWNGKFYEKLRNNPATVRGYIDFISFGNEKSLTVPKSEFPANVTSGFNCGLENIRPGLPFSKDLKCRAAFRWPRQSIDVEGSPFDLPGPSFVTTESFSPFPSNLRLNPFLERRPAFGISQETPQVTFMFSEPVSFARKEFEIHDVQLVEGPSTRTGWGQGQRGR